MPTYPAPFANWQPASREGCLEHGGKPVAHLTRDCGAVLRPAGCHFRKHKDRQPRDTAQLSRNPRATGFPQQLLRHNVLSLKEIPQPLRELSTILGPTLLFLRWFSI